MSVGVRGVVRGSAEAAWRALEGLTPGQRWTATLAAALALTVLAFGMPDAITSSAGGPAAAAADDLSTAAAKPKTSTPGSGAPHAAPEGARGGAISVPALGGQGSVEAAGGSSDEVAAAPASGDAASSSGVVALVQPDAAGADASTGDAAMARAYLAAAHLDATVVPIADVASTCRAATAVGIVAVASGSVADHLRRCLVGAGVTLVSFDDGGAIASDTAAALSTRRGVALSLLDSAERLSGALRGKVAVVADERFRPAIDGVAGALAERGVKPVTAVYLADGDTGVDPRAVVDVAGKGADTIVFATSVTRQVAFGSQYAVVHPGARFVVADAGDSLTNAAYPPSFDGAVAATALQYPWFRPEGEGGAVRDRCEQTWDGARTSPVPRSTEETVRALSWCQEVAIAAEVVAQPGGSAADALRARTLPSPLTAPLGAVDPPWSFGPTEVATATWSASCRCWAATAPFASGGSRAR